MPLSESLTKRVGPLPVWGWGAVVIGSVGVFLILRKRSASSTASATDLGSSTGAGGGAGGGSGGGGGGSTAPTSTPTSGPPSFTNPPAAPSTPQEPTGTVAPLQPLTPAEEATIVHHPSSVTPAIAAKVIANNLAASIDFASRQVENAAPGTGISYTSNGAIGATASQRQAANEQVASALSQRGYVASTYGGQVYAARDSLSFMRSLPPIAQQALVRWIQGTQNRAA